jgi:hypothetical protein
METPKNKMSEKRDAEGAVVVEAETASPDMDKEGPNRISSHTILAVLAVNLIYFAQLINLIGAGAVSPTSYVCGRSQGGPTL